MAGRIVKNLAGPKPQDVACWGRTADTCNSRGLEREKATDPLPPPRNVWNEGRPLCVLPPFYLLRRSFPFCFVPGVLLPSSSFSFLRLWPWFCLSSAYAFPPSPSTLSSLRTAGADSWFSGTLSARSSHLFFGCARLPLRLPRISILFLCRLPFFSVLASVLFLFPFFRPFPFSYFPRLRLILLSGSYFLSSSARLSSPVFFPFYLLPPLFRSLSFFLLWGDGGGQSEAVRARREGFVTHASGGRPEFPLTEHI